MNPASSDTALHPQRQETHCTVCGEEIVTIGILKCGHVFCIDCITKWSQKHNVCPLCRTTFHSITVQEGLASTYELSVTDCTLNDHSELDSSAASSPTSLFEHGIWARHNNRPEEAETSLRSAVALQDDFHLARFVLAQVLGAAGKGNEAETLFSKLIAADAVDSTGFRLAPIARNSLGQLMEQDNRRAEAEHQYREAIKSAPTFVGARQNLAQLLWGTGRLHEAEKQFRLASAVDEFDAEALCNLGFFLHQRLRWSEAADVFRKAIEANPSHPEAHYNLAVIFHDTNHRQEALEEYRTCLVLHPSRSDAMVNLALLLLLMAKVEEGMAILRQAVKASKEQKQHANLLPVATGHLAYAESIHQDTRRQSDSRYLSMSLAERLDFETDVSNDLKRRPNDPVLLASLNSFRRSLCQVGSDVRGAAPEVPTEVSRTGYGLNCHVLQSAIPQLTTPPPKTASTHS